MRREWESDATFPPRGGVCPVKFATIHPRRPRKLIRLPADADVLSVLEKLADFESIFPSGESLIGRRLRLQLFNFQYYISCKPELGLKF